MRSRAFFLAAMLGVSTPAWLVAQCGFPWTVTASDAGGAVAVNLCGIWVGCSPHDFRCSVSENQIQLDYTAAELPSCICTQSQIDFNQTVLVPSVAPGRYTVTATVFNCGLPTVVGTGSATVSASSAIPGLDARGMAALALLLGLVGFWRLRS